MCSYEEVIEQDTKTTLREHYSYGELSIDQFWRLNGEKICEEAYQAISDSLANKAENYTKFIGSEL